MPENEFEKQVRRLMEEFHLAPSESIWRKVEQQINKDKRRSRWLIVPLLLSILTLSGYFIYQSLQHSNNINKNTGTLGSKKDFAADKSIQQKNNDTISKNKTQTTPAQQEYTFTLKQQNDRSPLKLLANQKNSTNRNSFPETRDHFRHPAPINNTDTEADNKKTSNLSPNAETIKNGQLIADEKKQGEKIIQFLTDENRIANDSPTEKQLAESEIRNTAGSLSMAAIENKTSKTVHQKARQWQWGITGFYGRSDVVENLLGIHFFQNYSAADYVSNPGQLPDSGLIKTSNFIKASSAFRLGVLVQKPISKRSSISVGVNYMQLHTKTETGTLIDSAINVNVPGLSNSLRVITYYKPGSGNVITNTYRFIEIPVMFQHRFNNSTKFPVYYNAGICLTQLINVHSLFYDRYNNIFYSENDLFRKTQLQVQFGLNTSLSLKRISLSFGPQLQYGLSSLLKNKNYGSQHLFNWGIQANILFQKK